MRSDYELRARGLTRLGGFGRAGVRVVALLTAAALLLNVPGAAVCAGATRAAGEVTFAGSLTVNGLPVVAGETFFSGSTVANAAGSPRSTLALSNLSRLELSGGATVRLDFTEASLDSSLDEGGARFFIPEGVRASVTTADASLSADAGTASLFSVEVGPEGTTVSVQSGRVEMLAAGVARTASAGELLKAARGGTPRQGQGQNLSGRQRAGLFALIAAGVLAVVYAVTRQEDYVPPPLPCLQPFILSGEPPPC